MSSSEGFKRPEAAAVESDRLEALRAMLSAPRRKIMEILYNGPANSGLIAERSGLSRSLVNHHLRVLMDKGLVRQSGGKPFRYYELTAGGRALLESVRGEQVVAAGGEREASIYLKYLYLTALVVLTGIFLYSYFKGEPQPLWFLGFLVMASPLAYATVKGFMRHRSKP